MTSFLEDDLAPPGETVFQSAPGQLAHLAASNAASIAQHVSGHDKVEFDPISGQRVFEPEGNENNTGQGYNLDATDGDGFRKPKLLPPGLGPQAPIITPDEGSEDMLQSGYLAFQKKKKFENEFQERADKVRRMHAPRFGKYYKDPDRPIYASEIKSWFHAWLGKQHLAAKYEYESTMTLSQGGAQGYMFTVECTVTGFKHTARASMDCKKDCQTGATWLFIDWMILNNHIDPRIIPFEKEDKYVDVKHVQRENEEDKRTIYTKKMRFVKAGTLSTDGSEAFVDGDPEKRAVWAHSAPSALDKANKMVEQIFGGKETGVGIEYVEHLQGSGKNRYHCRLCDIEVTDESGRAMHVRGRKHKLNYKRFVDPDLGIGKLTPEEEKVLKQDVLEYQKAIALEHKSRALDLEDRDQELMHHEQLENFCEEIFEDFDDEERADLKKAGRELKFKCPNLRHIYAHASTFPKEENEDLCLQKLAVLSDYRPIDGPALSDVNKFENVLLECFKEIDSENPNSSWMEWPHPIKRVGTFVSGFPRENDKENLLQLVVVCCRHPTRELVQGVVEKVRKKLNPRESNVAITKVQPSTFSVNYGKRLTLPVYFTAHKLFNKTTLIPRYYGTPLEREHCIKLLMDIERKTYFKRYMSPLPNYTDTLNIMRDICLRSGAWKVLDGWPLQVIVNNALASSLNCSVWPSRHKGGSYTGIGMQPQPMPIHLCVRRVFEYVSSGALSMYGLLDPVELIEIDRQTIKKLVGYDEDDTFTLEATTKEQDASTSAMIAAVDNEEPVAKPAKRARRSKFGKKADNVAKVGAVEVKKSKFGTKVKNLPPIEIVNVTPGDGSGLEISKKIKQEYIEEDTNDNAKTDAPKPASETKKEAMETDETVKVKKVEKDDEDKWSDDEDGKTAAKKPKIMPMSFVRAGEVSAPEAPKTDKTGEQVKDSTLSRPRTKHIDLMSAFRPQHVEDVTASSHTALRMCCFGMFKDALGIKDKKVEHKPLNDIPTSNTKKGTVVKLPDTSGIDFTKDR